jgi:hypothetical protein
MNGKALVQVGTMVADSAGQQAVDKAAAAGVPWAVIVKLVQQVVVVAVGTLGGDRAQCLAKRLTKPATAGILSGAVQLDFLRSIRMGHSGKASDAPGKSTWYALRTSLQACNFTSAERMAIEIRLYEFFAKASVSDRAERAARRKIQELHDKISAAKQASLDNKLAIIQAEARAKKAVVEAKAADRSLFTGKLAAQGSGGGGGMLAIAGLGLLLMLARKR